MGRVVGGGRRRPERPGAPGRSPRGRPDRRRGSARRRRAPRRGGGLPAGPVRPARRVRRGGHARPRRSAHAPALRRQPRGRARAPPARRRLHGDPRRGRRDPLDRRGDAGGDAGELRATAGAGSTRCWVTARRRSRRSPATGSTSRPSCGSWRSPSRSAATGRSTSSRRSSAPTPSRPSSATGPDGREAYVRQRHRRPAAGVAAQGRRGSATSSARRACSRPTGMVGQQFIKDADAASWRLSSPMPDDLRGVRVDSCTPGRGPHLMFSALDANAAKDVEPAFAQAGHLVISNARSYRMDPLVPLLIPEVNPDHLALLPAQRRERGWRGRHRHQPELLDRRALAGARAAAAVRIRSVMVTTLQAVSGAGYPGVASLDILGNVVPASQARKRRSRASRRRFSASCKGRGVDAASDGRQRADDQSAGRRRSH